MRELPAEFDHRGFHHHRVAREGMVGIYRRRRIGGEAEHYEVIKVHVERATVIKGVEYAERENYPKSEEWGRQGWTYPDFGEAWKKFMELVGVSQTVTGGG